MKTFDLKNKELLVFCGVSRSLNRNYTPEFENWLNDYKVERWIDLFLYNNTPLSKRQMFVIYRNTIKDEV